MNKNDLPRITGHTLLVGLIADPIRHSMSPTMHNLAFEKLGLDYAYMVFEVDNTTLEDAVKGYRALGVRGSNVSMPNKQAIIPYLDEISEAAKLVGAVNTVVNKGGKGHLVGHITDGTGCMEALRQEDVEIKDAIVTICGIGGAGTAIAIQAALDGAKKLYLVNQKDNVYDNAIETVDKINKNTNCEAIFVELENEAAFKDTIAQSSVYIDATGVGMKPLEDQSLINDPEVIREDLVIMDIVYIPEETKLLKFAKENNAKKAINGLGMMLYQGAEAFSLITGEQMPVEYVKSKLFKE
ncbi:MAG TPA: shikimate dehydrogenase [Erysipelothrix sp.]|nr:shikimate dehydrogenase [Erysipelothrix sp.]